MNWFFIVLSIKERYVNFVFRGMEINFNILSRWDIWLYLYLRKKDFEFSVDNKEEGYKIGMMVE